VLESAREAYVAVDADGRLTDLNHQAGQLLGLDPARAVGRSVESVLTPPSRERFRAALDGARSAHPGADPDPLELRMVGAFGREFQAELSVWGVERRGGTVLHAFLRDVTSRREQEQAAALLAAVVEGSSDAVLTETPRGAITSWNPAAERTFGWRAEDVLGEPSVLLVPLEHLAEHHQLLAAVLDGERVRGLETERVTRGGTLVPVSLRMSPVYDGVGRVVAVSTTARDVTEELDGADPRPHPHRAGGGGRGGLRR
jgi:PAS domain S-box-containing protein